MKKEDFRTIGNEARAVIRRRAVALVVSRGQSRQEAADILGVSRQTVSGWLQRYEASGQPGLDDGRRNEHRRDAGILTAAEARKIQAWIIGRCPDQMRLPFALWTAPAVRELILRKFGKALGLSTMQLYLKGWGVTPQMPRQHDRRREQSRSHAVHDLPRRTERGHLRRFPETPDEGCGPESLSHRGQPARAPRPESPRVAGGAKGQHRDFLSAGLCTRIQSRRISQQRPEAADQKQTTSG